MQLTRRDLGALCASVVAATALAGRAGLALAEEDNGTAAAIQAFTGGAEVGEGGVTLGAPEIAENGSTVPIEVSADGAAAIMILASANPNPGVATFEFSALSGSSSAATRIRLAKTQDVIAIARMGDGSFSMAKRQIKVTIGGCGG
ncbi:MAG TPA: thiosulfate oxidation carrier protein SoxY [Thermohalobaculum sp.]|nr:thiosulfate oxidation carrier protein SoxY [Thermohalobaculum sp.]